MTGKKLAIVSGCSGQDGSYLAELLLEKDYSVLGFSRRTGTHSTERIDHLMGNEDFVYEEGDVTDPHYVYSLFTRNTISEFYNLAAQSHVGQSFETPDATNLINYQGVLNILNAIKTLSPQTKMYQASTSEMFGDQFSMIYDVQGSSERFNGSERTLFYDQTYANRYGDVDCTPTNPHDGVFQDEETTMNPQSPYAIAKLAAHHAVRLYRESYGLRVCSGILYNHESCRRGENFVTQKIVKWFADFKQWKEELELQECNKECGFNSVDRDVIQLIRSNPDNKPYPDEASWVFGNTTPKLRLGNLTACRDWGHASDYVQAMWLMLQKKDLQDYVIGTGETHTVQDFLEEICELCCGHRDYKKYVVIDPKFLRPAEVDYLRAKPDRANKELGWTPKHDFKSLARDMYEAETAKVR
jgi:GDPmannose 4,6-dehydratase